MVHTRRGKAGAQDHARPYKLWRGLLVSGRMPPSSSDANRPLPHQAARPPRRWQRAALVSRRTAEAATQPPRFVGSGASSHWGAVVPSAWMDLAGDQSHLSRELRAGVPVASPALGQTAHLALPIWIVTCLSWGLRPCMAYSAAPRGVPFCRREFPDYTWFQTRGGDRLSGDCLQEGLFRGEGKLLM